MLMKNTTFDNNFFCFSLNVTTFGMFIDNIKINIHMFLVVMDSILVGTYEFLFF